MVHDVFSLCVLDKGTITIHCGTADLVPKHGQLAGKGILRIRDDCSRKDGMRPLALGAFEPEDPNTVRAATVFKPAVIKTAPHHTSGTAARAGDHVYLKVFHSLVIDCLGKTLETLRQ